jgi:glycosyltransferase involved in cell wall biosynthesis
MRLKYVSWSDNTGYAVAAKSYIRALRRAGVSLTWTPMVAGPAGYVVAEPHVSPQPDYADVWYRPLEYDTVLIHTVPEYYPEWIARERALGKRVFGYTVWELERLPAHWPQILNQLDGVLVPCRWNEKVFRDSGVTVPIHVVPHLPQLEDLPAITEADRKALAARLRNGRAPDLRDRFVFYTIGYWSNRKAPYLALEAYWQAFDADDPVHMVVKTSDKDITRWTRSWRNGFRLRHPSPVTSARRLARKYSRPASWTIIADETLSDGEMRALHDIGDYFVSLARAEGWGLGAFDAVRLGKPVVMTGFGGQCDFLDPDLARLVDFDMVPVHEPAWGASYTPADKWTEPSVAQAASYLRDIYTNQAAAHARARTLAGRIAERFSPENIVGAMMAALQS